MDARSIRVHGYVSLVAAAAALMFAAVAVTDRALSSQPPLILTSLLLIAGVVAQRFPVHLSDKTKVYVDAAIFVAAALVLQPAAAMLLAAVVVCIDEVILRVSRQQALFNVAQTAVYVGAGALTFRWLAPSAASLNLAELETAFAILAAAAVMHLLNTTLVAGIVALQLRRSAYRTWREGFSLDLPQHVALVAIGVVLAIVARDYPWLTPLFVPPLGFVYLSLRRRLQLQQATRSTLLAAADLLELAAEGQAGHSRRVALWARQLAQRLGLDPEEIEDVEAAARLHHLAELIDRVAMEGPDLGKREDAGAPSGAIATLATFPAYARTATAIRHLGERWDGTGLPSRLAAEAIPLPSRVVAVADAFDRLISDPDAPCAADLACVLATLLTGASREWDPRVIEAMVTLSREGLSEGTDSRHATTAPASAFAA